MPKVTVYVSDELKARMDAVGDSGKWSAAAQRAFETEVSSNFWRKDTDTMEGVVERLKASKAEFLQETQTSMEEIGRTWAMHHADFDALVRLERVDFSKHDTADRLYAWVPPQIYPDWPSSMSLPQWWYTVGNFECDPTDEEVRAFVDGALAVWEEVKRKV